MLDVICHSATHPVYGLPEKKAFIVVDDYFLVFFVYFSVPAQFFEISSDHFITDLHEIMDKNIMAVGIEKMQCDFAVG